MSANRVTAVCAFSERSQAQQAVEELKRADFREGQIGVITQSEDTEAPSTESDGSSKVAAGAAAGMAAGAGVGVLWALGIAAAVFPPLGVVAGGTAMAVIASAATGAAVAGLAGALIGLGLSKDEAEYFEGEIKAGRTLVTVKSDGRYEEALAILRRAGGYDMSTRTTFGRESTRKPGPGVKTPVV